MDCTSLGQFLTRIIAVSANLVNQNHAIPNEYYDNEDGFWDDYIEEKDMERSKIPLNYYRPHVNF